MGALAESLGIFLKLIMTVSLEHYVFSKVLKAPAQPSSGHQMVSESHEKQKQGKHQKHFLHGTDIITYEFHKKTTQLSW